MNLVKAGIVNVGDIVVQENWTEVASQVAKGVFTWTTMANQHLSGYHAVACAEGENRPGLNNSSCAPFEQSFSTRITADPVTLVYMTCLLTVVKYFPGIIATSQTTNSSFLFSLGRKQEDLPPPMLSVSADSRQVQPKTAVYLSVLVSLLQPFQSGWSTSQLNLAQFNDTAQCNARPVDEGTCLMFPGHSKLEWTFAVNAWIFGAMIGSLSCGRFSDKWGRKKLLLANCGFIAVGAVVQMSVSNIWPFAVGRLIAGIASGVATGTIGAYVNELSPPHMRNVLGLGLQISVTFGIMMPAVTFFFANTSTGWRFLAGFPLVLAALFLVLAPSLCVESPSWLLMQNRREEAEHVITRLYGVENVNTVLEWLDTTRENEQSFISAKEANDSMFDPKYRQQLAGAILLSCSQQLSGINAVFYYSSEIFSDAGISDPRVGTLIIDFINIWPAFFTGFLAIRFGNRTMILWGLAGMLVMAVGMTLAFLVNVPALSVLFTALYVIIFGVTLGPLVWVMTADIFPDAIRASASSLCIGINWLCNLVVGVSYPYLADALKDYSYVPFVVLLAVFFIMALKLVPETSGKTSAEIQLEYEQRRRI